MEFEEIRQSYKEDIRKLQEKLADNEEEAVLFIETKGENVPVGKTKIGGLPDLPPDIDYPVREEFTNNDSPWLKMGVISAMKMPLIAQINLADLYAVEHGKYYPDEGMLYIFWTGEDPEYYEKNHKVKPLKAFYWNGDMSTLVRTPSAEGIEVIDEYSVEFELCKEHLVSDIASEASDLLGCLCDDYVDDMPDYEESEEYKILEELTELDDDVSRCDKIGGFKAGFVQDGDYYVPYLQINYSKFPNHGAIWYVYFGLGGQLKEMKGKSGWNEIRAYLENDVD